ncbi:hypothetical protein ASE05_29265 [Mesorhizobium sp. Root172]|nr:hypothetical protein ASE05_29265 [Mesorhizobium sp. Root172]
MALGSYRAYVNGFPVTSNSPLVIGDPSGSTFKCDLKDFMLVLNDEQQLYRVLFPSYVALVEDLARELVEKLLSQKGAKPNEFVGLDPKLPMDEAAEQWITFQPVETWAMVILKFGGRGWSSFQGGRRGVVEAVTIRNLCAHGIPVINKKALNRLASASTQSQRLPSVGDQIVLDRATFSKHVATLRRFARSMADSVANMPDMPEGLTVPIVSESERRAP